MWSINYWAIAEFVALKDELPNKPEKATPTKDIATPTSGNATPTDSKATPTEEKAIPLDNKVTLTEKKLEEKKSPKDSEDPVSTVHLISFLYFPRRWI